MKSAYWITPENKIIPVPITHINCIINNPDLFDVELPHIKQLYGKYDEPLGFEGRARREIMTEIINRGFIRVRLKPREWEWYMECRELNDKTTASVEQWIAYMKEAHNKHSQYDLCKQIHIVSISDLSEKRFCI